MSKPNRYVEWDETEFDRKVEEIFRSLKEKHRIPYTLIDAETLCKGPVAMHLKVHMPLAYAFFKYLLCDAPLGPSFANYCEFLHDALENEMAMREASPAISAGVDAALNAMREGPKS